MMHRRCIPAAAQAVVAAVEDLIGHRAQLLVLRLVHDDPDLALVDDGVELALDLGVEDLADVAEAEAGLKVGLRNADTDHIALAGVHNALDAVEEGVDLALHNGLEVGLHVLARDLDDVGQGDLGADRDLVKLGTVDRDLVVLDLGGVSRGDQLEA